MSGAPMPLAHMIEFTRAAAQERPLSLPAARTTAITEPLPITDQEGLLAGWLFGIVAGKRLLGFTQFDASGHHMRTSWFPARASVAECPRATTWLDAEAVRRVAATIARSDERLGRPQLTYDRDPTRLLWRVPVQKSDRPAGFIAVAGETGYREPTLPPDDRTG